VINLVLLELFISSFDLPELAAQALAVALVTPVNFIGNKLWTFGDSSV
jgi:putative flippase GtrA